MEAEFSQVELATEIPLSRMQRLQLRTQAAKLLGKHSGRFGFAQIRMHLKNDGPQLACQLNFVTDGGRYHATVSGWDARTVVQQAVDNLDLQVIKHFGKAY